MKVTKYNNGTVIIGEKSDPPSPFEKNLKTEYGSEILTASESFGRLEFMYAPSKDSFNHYHITLTEESTVELRDYLNQLLEYLEFKKKAIENAEVVDRDHNIDDFIKGMKDE